MTIKLPRSGLRLATAEPRGEEEASPKENHGAIVRVLIAEDQPDFRAALEDLIAGEPSLELVGTAHDADQAIDIALKERPEVALLDVSMPNGGGARAASEIRARSPETCVLALSAFHDREDVLGMIRAGASGYLLKDTTSKELIKAIIHAARGEAILSRRITADVLDELATLLNRAEDLTEELKVLDRTKRELVQTLSHELLSPLTVIQGMVVTLTTRGTELSSEDAAAMVASATRATARLKRLARNVSAVAGLGHKGVEIHRRTLPVIDLLSGAASEFPNYEDSLRLPSEEAETSGSLSANSDLAQRALVLVIENALQFSPVGEIVDVAIKSKTRTIEIQISDRGPGVPEELRERIFDPFVQADGSSTRTHQGIGMGLYLARRIMEAQGGKIVLLPRKGGGSTFILVFPQIPTPFHESSDLDSGGGGGRCLASEYSSRTMNPLSGRRSRI